MFTHELLGEHYNYKQAEILQEKYSKKIEDEKQKSNYYISNERICTIMGVDISYFNRNDQEWGVACAILWDLSKNSIIEKYFAQAPVKFPYYPGFLGFRENNLLVKTIIQSPILPDLVMCDGHGIIHPRKFGEAVHLGVLLQVPTFGVAKNPFIGYCSLQSVDKKKGKRTPVWAIDPKSTLNSDNEMLGYAICLSDNKKPVFVSAGYKTTLEIAIQISLKTAKENRQPEPLYLADKFSKLKIKELN